MMNLDDWQKEVLEYDGNILLCTGRRVGKTYIFCEKAIDVMMKRPNTRIGLSSLTEDQAMFIINTMKTIAQEKCSHLIGKKKKKPTLRTLTFTNGSIAFSRPVGASGDSWRGYELDYLYVDEASRMPKLFWSAAKPTLMTTGGKLWMSSTPHGKQGYFWERFNEVVNKKEENARFKVIYKTSEEVIKERPISESWTEEQKRESLKLMAEDMKEMSRLEYGQEYLGLFLEDLNQFFPDELIGKCQIEERREREYRYQDIYIGVDIARFGGDEICYEVFARDGDNIVQLDSITKKNQPTNQTENDIKILNEIWKPKRIGIDAGSGSLGVGIYDNLMTDAILKYKIVPMNNRAISLDREDKQKQRLFKEDMYNNLKALMEQGRVRLLKDIEIRASLASVQCEIKEENVKIFGDYTHHAEGIVRAVYLASKEKINKIWISYI